MEARSAVGLPAEAMQRFPAHYMIMCNALTGVIAI
jgi:hypothetical protein